MIISNKLTNNIILFFILSGLFSSSGFTLKALCDISIDGYSSNYNPTFYSYFMGFLSIIILLEIINSLKNIIPSAMFISKFNSTLLLNTLIGLIFFYCVYYINIIAGTLPFRLLQSFYHYIFYTTFLFSVYIAGFIQGLIISMSLKGQQIFNTFNKIEITIIIIILVSFFIMGYYLELA